MTKKRFFHIIIILLIISAILYYILVLSGIYGSSDHIASNAVRPDTFGSVAVPTSKSPYSQKWRNSVKFGSGPLWSRMLADVTSKKSDKDKLIVVQKVVNGNIIWGPDSALWGREDYWSSPNETLKKGAGDCEDVAILKMMLLRAAGFSVDNLYLVIGLDTAARQAHAVLIARSDGRFWVLDQRIDAVVADKDYGFFAPVISMGEAQSWVHGYKLLGVWFTTSHSSDLADVKK